jgi:hypothetical protein
MKAKARVFLLAAIACAGLIMFAVTRPSAAFEAVALSAGGASSRPNDNTSHSIRRNFILVQQKTGAELMKCNHDCEAEYQDCTAHGIKRGKEMRSWQGRKDITPIEKCTIQKAFCIEWECIKGAHPPASFYQH